MSGSVNISGLSGALAQAGRLQEHLFHLWLKAVLFPMNDHLIVEWEECQAQGAHLVDQIHHLGELEEGMQQPALEQLAAHRDQFESLSRVLLLKVSEGTRLTEEDFEMVAQQNRRLLAQYQRFEKAFHYAAGRLDVLTGLRTRQGMMAELQAEQNRFERRGEPFCVAICDIDHFKSVNDTYGHDVGDRTLEAVANGLIKSLRSFDEVYRLGGEEFLICLKDTDLENALKVLDRLRKSIAALEVELLGFDETVLQVTASFGVAEVQKGVSLEKMIASADEALYSAKRTGRNQVCSIQE